jgi:unsaturated pyranuronate lyase
MKAHFFHPNNIHNMKLTGTKAFIHSTGIAWEKMDPGVERRILGFDENLMMVCVRFEKGAVGNLHHHVHRQVTYVESGRFEVTIDGEKNTLGAGDCFFVKPDLLHGVVALEKGTLVDVFTPARAEFIQ